MVPNRRLVSIHNWWKRAVESWRQGFLPASHILPDRNSIWKKIPPNMKDAKLWIMRQTLIRKVAAIAVDWCRDEQRPTVVRHTKCFLIDDREQSRDDDEDLAGIKAPQDKTRLAAHQTRPIEKIQLVWLRRFCSSFGWRTGCPIARHQYLLDFNL